MKQAGQALAAAAAAQPGSASVWSDVSIANLWTLCVRSVMWWKFEVRWAGLLTHPSMFQLTASFLLFSV